MGRKNRRKQIRIRPVKLEYIKREKTVSNAMIPERGQIWFANLGLHGGTSVQEGIRPVLIFSNNVANAHAETVTVLPMTSHLKKTYLPTHVQLYVNDCCGISRNSMVLAEQITTIGKAALGNYVGEIKQEKKMEMIEAAVKVQLFL